MHILFEVLATILMIINVLYVIRVFFILKNSKNSDNLKKKNLNIVGDLYIALLILFVVGYVCISLNNNGENSIQLNIMAQIMFWGAVFVFISVYVFRTLLKITKDQYIGELSDLQISLDTYIKSIPGGVHHCVVEPELRVYYVSKGFTDITGYTMVNPAWRNASLSLSPRAVMATTGMVREFPIFELDRKSTRLNSSHRT